MNPKDKAKELCYLYQGDFEKGMPNMSWTMAKKCALIAVDEITKALRKDLAIFEKGKGYWQDVKQEIEKL